MSNRSHKPTLSKLYQALFDALSREAIAKLELCKKEVNYVTRHAMADATIMNLLNELGYSEIAEKWKEAKAGI